MLLTTQHVCVSTGTGSKGNLVRLGHFNWHAGVLSHCAASVTLGVSIMLLGRPHPVSPKISQGRAHRRAQLTLSQRGHSCPLGACQRGRSGQECPRSCRILAQSSETASLAPQRRWIEQKLV